MHASISFIFIVMLFLCVITSLISLSLPTTVFDTCELVKLVFLMLNAWLGQVNSYTFPTRFLPRTANSRGILHSFSLLKTWVFVSDKEFTGPKREQLLLRTFMWSFLPRLHFCNLETSAYNSHQIILTSFIVPLFTVLYWYKNVRCCLNFQSFWIIFVDFTYSNLQNITKIVIQDTQWFPTCLPASYKYFKIFSH